MTMYSPASITQLEIEQSIESFNTREFPAGPALEAYGEFLPGGDFTIIFTRETAHGPRAFHAIYNDPDAVDKLLSQFDDVEVEDGTLVNLIEELEAEYNTALVAGHGDWLLGTTILEKERAAQGSKHKLANGTRVRAKLGETSIVGTIDNNPQSKFHCNDIRVEGTPRIGHHDYITCWDESSWEFEILPALGSTEEASK